MFNDFCYYLLKSDKTCYFKKYKKRRDTFYKRLDFGSLTVNKVNRH